jgi:hypothetical protein
MVSDYVMTEQNCRSKKVAEDSVGLASYNMDSHNCQRVVQGGVVKNEGDVQSGTPAPYGISYRSLVPRVGECENLLVPWCLSASHMGFGSIRMEPVFMVLGQAAGVAASMALEAGVPVQWVDVAALQRELRENPLADGSVPEVLVDDGSPDRVQITGAWTRATAGGQFGPSVLRHAGAGGGSVRFRPAIERAGRYAVYLYWPRSGDLATRAPVVIRHAGGTERLVVNLRDPGETAQGGIAQWTRLGEFRFEPGSEAWLEVGSEGADGVVFADAALFVPAR